MAYREHGMQEVLEVLRRAHRGLAKADIASGTGRGRRTVRRWIATAIELGWTLATEPDEALAEAVLERCRPGRPPTPSETAELLAPHREQLREWLRPGGAHEHGLRLRKAHELLTRKGVHVPYNSLHRYVCAELGFADKRRITVHVADCMPGEVAEVDFGRLSVACTTRRPASTASRTRWW